MKLESKRGRDHLVSKMPLDANIDRYLDNRATIERLRKSQDIRIVEGVQRICGTVLTLHRSADIDDSHVAASERWYKDYVMGVEGARDPERVSTGRAPDIHAAMLARTAACHRHRCVREALGLCSEVRLHLLLVAELSFSAIADRLMPGDVNGRKKVAAQVVFLLEQLAEHYQATDQRARRARRSEPAS